jgi:glucose-1-phosphate adenylyltransferase
MPKVTSIILAGGQGTRLYPLTKLRSKPAVPIAGKFRLIDIPLSNCIHAGLRRIFILTQFSSVSLHRHIFNTYLFDTFSKDYISILTAQQTLENRNWYQGTADAVRQNLRFIDNGGDIVLVLSGDHLYRMDYSKFINFHIQNKADITISVYPVSREQSQEFGVMKVDDNLNVVDFLEKPKTFEQQERMKVDEKSFKKFNINPEGRTHLASMGIYVFNKNILENLLEQTDFEDFGKEVIPFALQKQKVLGYFFNGYWEDIGTIRSFFETHLELTKQNPPFAFYNEDKPIYTHARFLPGSKVYSSQIDNSVVCEGSILNHCNINNSIIGVRSMLGENSTFNKVILMGADYFESNDNKSNNQNKQLPNVGIGAGCEIRNAIIDKNARIGNKVKLLNIKNYDTYESDNFVIRDGIIVVPKNAIIEDGFEI